MQNHQLLTPKEKQVLDSQREIDWLKRQIQQYEQKLDSSPDLESMLSLKPSEEDNTIESHKETIDELREKLDVMTQFNLSKDSLTNAVDASHNVLRSLYRGLVDHDSFERSRAVKVKIDERDELTSLFLTGYEQLRKAKNELALTQAKIIDCHQENRELMQTLRDLKEQAMQEMEQLEQSEEGAILASQVTDHTER
ncbi:hypothetical protein BDB00DRAFT_467870 [Zychaea mexicana]|uniref:uncharacterized protein n=1 Tax=Zychaea mexicana TaxID=64656 RepID=UPI0022FDD564|nr:uncharacterized protein BDB00DRAFT_467870 [Zychaea mexicana]KAI9491858.1 hypothetical protein BDB00DRAFT_467870 [Zychaea mexicana]